MKTLNRLSIKVRLLIIMILSLAAVGVIAVYSLNVMVREGRIIDTINAHPMIVTAAAGDSKLLVAQIMNVYDEAYIEMAPDRRENYERRIVLYEMKLDENIKTIQQLILTDKGKALAGEAAAAVENWRKQRENLLPDIYSENRREPASMTLADDERNGTAAVLLRLDQVQTDAASRGHRLAEEAAGIRAEARVGVVVLAIVLTTLLYSFTRLNSRMISGTLRRLQDVMAESTTQDTFVKAELPGENEIVEVGHYYNDLIGKLEIQFEMKSGLGRLSQVLSGYASLKDSAEKALSFLCEYTHSGNGVFYLANSDDAALELVAAYAINDRQKQRRRLMLGETVVGQAAQDQKIIVLRHVTRDEAEITTGTTSEAPLNVIALPLMFEGQLCGVIELASFETYDAVRMEYLSAASEILAASVYAAVQQEKIHRLLVEAKQAYALLEQHERELHAQSEELDLKNRKLSELLAKSQLQSEELQVQHEELRQNNEELEAQARAMRKSESRLQVQQEELRLTNEELQAQAQELMEKKAQLKQKNEDLERAHTEMVKKAEALEKAISFKSEFMANMSHELRTPLNSILVLSELLIHKEINTPLTEKETEFASIIHSSGQDLLTMINSVLDLAKVEAGKLEVHNEKVPLTDILNEHRRMFEPQAEMKSLDLQFSIDPASPEFIETDALRLGQILKNLISNAIKFTHTGRVEVCFRPVEEAEAGELDAPADEFLAIAVRDTGIGIPQEKMQEIFEAFKQSDGTTSRQYGGTGLGLTISIQLARLLGGKILHESEIGEGSEFVLVLPIKPVQLEMDLDIFGPAELAALRVAADDTAGAYGISSQQPEAIVGPGKNDKKMLIIEEDPVFAQVLSDLAEEKGYEAVRAFTGEEGIMKAKSLMPDGAILNLSLPDMDGMHVARVLSEDKATAAIPIHILSDTDKAPETGVLSDMPKSVVGVLNKPADMQTLSRTLSEIEDRDQMRGRAVLIVGSCGEEDFHGFAEQEQIGICRVSTGQEGLCQLEGGQYGCVVVDVNLPDMHGIDFMKMLQEKAEEPLPIIVYADEVMDTEEIDVINRYSETIILKSAKSRDRLMDEVLLFLHDVRNSTGSKRSAVNVLEKDRESLTGVRVLLADDNVRNVLALVNLLEMHGMQVVVAKDGQDAVRKFEEHDVDLILMDIMMPNMDGYEAIRKIREAAKGHKIPIIALTAKAMMGDRDKCISAGANDYLAKPVESGRLLSMIKVWQSC